MPQYILDMLDEKGIAWSLHSSIEEVMAEVDILYMTRVQKERLDPSEYANVKAQFVLRASDLHNAKANMKVLHPLPRVDEIATDVDKTPHAWYFQQAGRDFRSPGVTGTGFCESRFGTVRGNRDDTR